MRSNSSVGDFALIGPIRGSITGVVIDTAFPDNQATRSVQANAAGTISCHLIGDPAGTWTKYTFVAGQSKAICIDQIRTHADTTIAISDLVFEI